MKQKLLSFAFAVLSANSFSQSQNFAFEDWKSTDGTQYFFYKNIVKTDASNNVYTLGATTTTNNTTDILLSKKNSLGVTLWTKQINGSADSYDFGSGLLITSTGDVYITGAITNNTTTLAPELILRKYNSSGTQQFSNTFSNGYGDVGTDIIINTTYNYVIVSGATYDNMGQSDMLVVVYDTGGGFQWNNTYDYNGLNDGAYKVTTRTNLLTITGPVTQSANNYKLASKSYNVSSGFPSGTVTVGATATSSVEIISDLVTDAAGNMYICGATQQNPGQGYDYYLAKVTPSLTISWEQTYNGSDNLDDQAKSVKVDASGNVYITGFVTSSTTGKDIKTIKYNSSGVVQWSVTVNSITNGNDEAFDMEIDASSNLYVTGTIENDVDMGDYYTVKYSSSGTKIWDIKNDGRHLFDCATNVALDSLQNVIITGQSETTPGVYNYLTMKMSQFDVTTPTDFKLESPSNNYMFFKNSGQLLGTDDNQISDVKFYTNYTNPGFYFKNTAQSFVFSKKDTVCATNDTLHRIDLLFNNCNESTKTYPMEQKREGFLNYFLGHTDSTGISAVFGNQRLITPELFNNIDLMSSSNQDGIKYYFIVKPGGDMRDIQMQFNGATSFSLNGTTNELSINSSIGSLIFDKPIAYQLTAGNATLAVTSFSPNWTTNGANNKYRFNDGVYTGSLTLVIQVFQKSNSVSSSTAIDNLIWSTYYGGTGGRESGQSIKTDNLGNIYVGGFSDNPSFPTTTGAYQTTYVANDIENGVLIKFNSSRQRQWSTYFGGSSADEIKSIVSDNTNALIYASGYTWSSDFPIVNKTGTTPSPAFQGYSDAFIAAFKSANGAPIWTNMIGTSGDERAYSICMDASGNKYITGYTATGLTTVNSSAHYMQTTYGGGSTDGYIAKFNSSNVLQWLTYYGGNAEDYPKSIATDASGNIIVWGQTVSSTFNTFDADPINHTAIYNTTNSGLTDFFILKFNSSGSRLWATLYGGDDDDFAADGGGIVTVGNEIYCLGTTFSSDMPIQQFGSTPTYNLNGTQDCYIVCFNSSHQEKWATYFGGSDTDYGGGITKDNNNNIFITGVTNSSDYASVPQTGFYNSSFYGNLVADGMHSGDAFVTAFANDTYAPVWSTFTGGQGDECGNSICINGTKLFITGETTSKSKDSQTPYPVVDPGNSAFIYQPSITSATGNGDILISEFDINNMSTQVGIEEKFRTNDDILIYPNPFKNGVNLTGLKTKSYLEVFDASGRIIFVKTMSPNEKFLPLNITIPGIYLLRISNGEGNYKTFKIVKE
ncbi:MAG: hypothetical protein K0S53_660 [Bacteroidetes bacterium]|jgi:hypothetical protein|nr:hypothetical protein [Bacteroidota bacterium]